VHRLGTNKVIQLVKRTQ